jgi:ergothioneine biosynthesis protein EgtB
MLYPDSAATVGEAARHLSGAALARALEESRAQTLRSADAYAEVLPGLAVPCRGDLNPPVWELGHVAWFQEWWTTRNPERARGVVADPEVARPPSWLTGADALYDSSRVAHATRWSLPLPDASRTREYLAAVLDAALAGLPSTGGDTDTYFHRLALFHEDMHNEAAIYMANTLGFAVPDARAPRAGLRGALAVNGGTHRLGWQGSGFAFDNEQGAHEVVCEDFEIDRSAVDNAAFAAFVEADGYANPRWWNAAGRAWLAQTGARHPARWRRARSGWEWLHFGTWRALDGALPAMNLTCHEAEAWCRWAGRRLPTEAEWEYAALTRADFAWGDVWEWTADLFRPYPGFVAHPYRDYSAPWFETRRVLRGGSIATHARMAHPRYRNFFTPERNDVFAGFRSCAA